MTDKKPELIRLVEVSPNSSSWTPLDMIRDAEKEIQEKGKPHNKAFLILLDTKSGGYHVNWFNANMSSAEVIALLEVVKIEMLKQMGYIDEC